MYHQKDYLEGINDYIEDIHVLQQTVQDAKARKRTVHISSFDLADTFGFNSCELIKLEFQGAMHPLF